MFFGAAALELVEVGEGEDIIPDHIVFAVVLVVAAVGRVMADVAFQGDARAAFVIVEPPAAVTEATDVVDMVMADRGPFRWPECIDPAHITQQPFTEMVEVVVFDAVTLGGAGGVAPAPTDGDGGIEQVGNLVVRDHVVRGEADPNADGAGVNVATVAEDAVVDGIFGRPFGWVRRLC